MEDVGPQNFSPRYEYPQDNEQKEILVTNHVEERAENSTLVEPPETMEAKKRKTEKHNVDVEQKASQNVLIPKRMRPSAPELYSSTISEK